MLTTGTAPLRFSLLHSHQIATTTMYIMVSAASSILASQWNFGILFWSSGVYQSTTNILDVLFPEVQFGNLEPTRKMAGIHQRRAESLKQILHVHSTRLQPVVKGVIFRRQDDASLSSAGVAGLTSTADL
jgi:hypothetical protein